MDDQLRQVAALLGHVTTTRESRRHAAVVVCTCGYESGGRRRRTANPVAVAREAELYQRNHLEKAVRDARVAGRVRVTAGGNVAVIDGQGETHLVDV